MLGFRIICTVNLLDKWHVRLDMVLLPLNLERSQKFSFCDAFGEVVLNQMIGLNLF
jgi:uncharacterized membrane protein YwaF